MNNAQVTVYDDEGNERRVSRAVAQSMGWTANPSKRGARADECVFCYTPMEPGATPGVWICPRCNAMRLYDAQ